MAVTSESNKLWSAVTRDSLLQILKISSKSTDKYWSYGHLNAWGVVVWNGQYCKLRMYYNLCIITPEFISPLLWPPNSPDLNPVDYKIWGVLQERVYRTRIRDVAHLKERLVQEWAKFDHCIIDRAIKQWRPRLRACIRAEGGHFEHQLWSP